MQVPLVWIKLNWFKKGIEERCRPWRGTMAGRQEGLGQRFGDLRMCM